MFYNDAPDDRDPESLSPAPWSWSLIMDTAEQRLPDFGERDSSES